MCDGELAKTISKTSYLFSWSHTVSLELHSSWPLADTTMVDTNTLYDPDRVCQRLIYDSNTEFEVKHFMCTIK